MEYAGLLFEFLFLFLGIYLYLFSIGKFSSKNAEVSKKSEAFRKENKGWMRILALALIAIMMVNIYIHLMQLWGK